MTSGMTINPCQPQKKGKVKITWDMTIYTDKELKYNRLDITLVHKDTQKWTRIDIALLPADQNIIRTEEEKVEKYQELALELDVPDFLRSVQLSAILGTAHLLRKVFCL